MGLVLVLFMVEVVIIFMMVLLGSQRGNLHGVDYEGVEIT